MNETPQGSSQGDGAGELRRDRERLRGRGDQVSPVRRRRVTDVDPAPSMPTHERAVPTGPAAGIGFSASHPVLGPVVPRLPETPSSVTILDRVAIVAAVVVPPIGLVLSFVARAHASARRGWPSRLARVATWVAAVMTVVVLVGGAFLWVDGRRSLEQRAAEDAAAEAHAAVVAESADFCAAIVAHDRVMFGEDVADFGWPQLDDPAGYEQAITQYAAFWESVTEVAPAAISGEVTSFADRLAQMVAISSALSQPNRPGDLLDLHSVPDAESIAVHVATYCE